MLKFIYKTTLVVLFTYPTFAFGQLNTASDYIVLTEGDTIYGRVTYLDERGVTTKFYKKIRVTDRNGKRKKYKTKSVIAFKSNTSVYRAFWLDNSSEKLVIVNPIYNIDSRNGRKEFLKVISEGPLSHYQLEWWEQGDALLMYMNLLKKANDTFFIRADQGVFGLKRKVLSKYFEDCPNLSSQITSKIIKNTWALVDYYNTKCN